MEGRRRPVVSDGLYRASEWSWRLLLVAAAVLAVVWALSKVFLVVVVVFAALLLSALLEPVARRLRLRGWGSGAATFVAVALGLLVAFGVVGFIAPAMVEEFGALGDQAAAGVREAQRWLVDGPLELSREQVNRIANSLVEQLQGEGRSVVSGVVSGAMTVGTILAGVLLAVVVAIFFVRDGRQIFNWLVRLLPAESRDRARQIGDIAWDTLAGYIRGIATVGLFDAVFIGIALAILGIPLVLPLMLLTFIGAFIPIVGASVAGLLAALVALVDQGVTAALIVVLVIIAIQQFEGNVLYPIVMRRAVHVHPVAVLLAVTTGAILAGILGAIVAVPLVAVFGRVVELRREEDDESTSPKPSPVGQQAVLLDDEGRPQFVPVQEVPSAASSRSTSD